MLYSETLGEIEDVLLDDVRLYLHSPVTRTHDGNSDLRPVEGRLEMAVFKHDLYPAYAQGGQAGRAQHDRGTRCRSARLVPRRATLGGEP